MQSEIAAAILEICTAKGWRIACAESLTGGLLADAFVSVPGASRTFAGSLVIYDIRDKEKILGVDGAVLREKGAVEEEVALQMALGAGKAFAPGPLLLLSTTGVAGPDTDGFKPVGTVCCAALAPGKAPALRTFHFSGAREKVRLSAVEGALSCALSLLGPSLE